MSKGKEDTKGAGGSEKLWDDLLEKEWEKARDLLEKFDDRIKDLRQWGFTAFTALIGVEGLLIPTLAMSTTTTIAASGTTTSVTTENKAIPQEVRLAVLAATILLIVTMRVIEKSYELFQRAASTRALVIERHLDMELTEIISDKYKRSHILALVTLAYGGFVGAVGVLGQFILEKPDLKPYLWAVTAAGLAAVAIISLMGLRYPHGAIDWTIGPPEITEEEKVRVTVTNLAPAERGEDEGQGDGKREIVSWASGRKKWKKIGLIFYLGETSRFLSRLASTSYRSTDGLMLGIREKERVEFGPVDDVCSVTREDGKVLEPGLGLIKTKDKISVRGQDSITWLWPQGDVKPGAGIYRFHPARPSGRKTLRRKVTVTLSKHT